jgi:hypothetical protein
VRRWPLPSANRSGRLWPSHQGLEFGVDLRELEGSSLPLCSAHGTGLTDPSDANIHCGSGADEIDQETAIITVDAISNSESDKGYRDCEEPDRDNQHQSAGGRYARGSAKPKTHRQARDGREQNRGCAGTDDQGPATQQEANDPHCQKGSPQRRFLLSVVFKVMPLM